ncbi:ShlB/FhaC/HecB family hemolysin secretion/activation protein [Caulobacter sp. SL161]|uniref:ShlB/FhaC/HecB family hemolysin secretion/activation protein n=1 Tax=Caulobacter sp. SL161 TaxID=2995156 RepID=UPI00227382E0|nr:ShlB/FhaC/HecB family hemolysin secretion/activation protein [Caulobacter sp. SL161]MCY1648315.1 ShlB/FhaC/HecB family hemolysin secretion/activation protein [Caulobacter sp. SL161]
MIGILDGWGLAAPLQGSVQVISTPNAGAVDSAPSAIILKQVNFPGATVVPPHDLQPAWQNFVGKPVALADLKTIARNAEAIYAGRGYPFVVVVPPAQTVVDGVVRLDVIEGQISDLTVLGQDASARRQATRIFQPLVGMRPLPAVAVERAYATARATPGLAVAGALRRGTKPGGMDLVVEAARDPWRVAAGVNNWAARPVGPWVATVQADYFGASSYGDQASIQASASPDFKAQYGFQARYERRLNAYGTYADAVITAAKAKPGGAVAELNLATNLIGARLEVGQNLVDDGVIAISLKAGLDINDQETLVFGSERLSREQLRTLSLGGEVTLQGENLKASASLELRKGVGLLGASKAGDQDLSRASADPKAAMVRWKFEGEWRVASQVLAARFEGQDTGSSLTTPDQYVIGNQTIGRGYQPGSAFADSAVAVSLELRRPGVKLSRSIKAEPFIFVDAARLSNPRKDIERLFDRRDLSSIGGGLRFDVPGPARFELLYALPSAPPLGLGEKKPAPTVLFSASVGLKALADNVLRRKTSGATR